TVPTAGLPPCGFNTGLAISVLVRATLGKTRPYLLVPESSFKSSTPSGVTVPIPTWATLAEMAKTVIILAISILGEYFSTIVWGFWFLNYDAIIHILST